MDKNSKIVNLHVYIILLLIIAVVFCYSNSLQGTFHFDDAHSIQENPSITTLNPKIIWSQNNRFRFIGFTSFALNYYWNGLEEMPGWHVVNIVLHSANVLMFYGVLVLLMRLLRRQKSKVPIMAALLFAVHPLLSEPVNYIQARHVLFYSLFTLCGAFFALLFIKAENRKNKIIFLGGMMISIVLGILSKEVGLFYVPAAIGLCFAALWNKDRKSIHISPAAFFVMGTGALIILILLTNWIRPLDKLFLPNFHPEIGRRTFITNLLTQVQVFFKYISLLVPLSSRLNADHHVIMVRLQTLLEMGKAYVPFLILLVIIVFTFLKRKSKPAVFFFFFWSLMAVLPYMLIAGGSQELMVEYKAYLPAIGFIGLVAIGIENIYHTISTKKIFPKVGVVSGTFFLLFIVFCMKETRARNVVW